MTYNINIPVFEGPFDLLLHLVKVNEMEIADINIAQITDRYLKTLRQMQNLDLEVAGEFLVMASTLIQLKVRSLLPEQPGEEEAGGEDISDIMNARQLIDHLIEYRKFKELSQDLATRQEEQLRVFYRNSVLPALEQAETDAPLKADLNLLFDCFARVLRFVEKQPRHDVAFEPFSVEDRIGLLRGRLKLEANLELFSLFRHCRNKADMIVTFLALLELSRLKEIRLEQPAGGKEVFVYRRDGHSETGMAPQYEGDMEAEEPPDPSNAPAPVEDEEIPEPNPIQYEEAEAEGTPREQGDSPPAEDFGMPEDNPAPEHQWRDEAIPDDNSHDVDTLNSRDELNED